jgi:hypothetical protein
MHCYTKRGGRETQPVPLVHPTTCLSAEVHSNMVHCADSGLRTHHVCVASGSSSISLPPSTPASGDAETACRVVGLLAGTHGYQCAAW